MTVPLAVKVEGKKFMWDGGLYDTEEEARQVGMSYQEKGFEIQLSPNTDKYLVYSRRVAEVQDAE